MQSRVAELQQAVELWRLAVICPPAALLEPPSPPSPVCRFQAHKGSTLCYHVTGLDMGFDNPVFAAIELDYAEADQVGSSGAWGGLGGWLAWPGRGREGAGLGRQLSILRSQLLPAAQA